VKPAECTFKDLRLSREYRSLVDNVVERFFVPVLSRSVRYRRAVGYFSSTALVEVSKGIAGLVRNGGTIELVASPYLSEEDVAAIRDGYERRQQIAEQAMVRSLDHQLNAEGLSRLNLLANLIAEGIMDIKIAFTYEGGIPGMYHEKMGLMYDSDDLKIAFSGSMNESKTAMLINYESIDVFWSWDVDGKERLLNKE
jgi:hypothetical protein